MGLAVATALAKRGGWELHLLDMNVQSGEKAVKELGNVAKFHKCNVTAYKDQADIFDSVHKSTGRLDFVYANAGIVERFSFYEKNEQSPPPEINQASIDVNLKGVVITSYLAQHYFRLSKESYGKGTQILIMTSSCGGLYPSPFSPMYSAAKHGVVGLMRSIAKHYYVRDKIRVCCTNPGTIKTNLLDVSRLSSTDRETDLLKAHGWSTFPEEYFTPIEKLVETVLMLIDGGAMEDSKGNKVAAGKDWMLAVEVNGNNHYFRDMPEYSDKMMEDVMKRTDVTEMAPEEMKYYN